MGTKDEQAEIWSTRGIGAVESYWNNTAHIKRCNWLASYLCSYDISSVFEVGIMGGRNIDIMKNKIPGVERFGGIDVNKISVDFAKEHVLGGDFEVTSVYDMDIETKYDLIFSVGVFIHIPPDGIDEAISRCVQKSNKYVAHLEGLGPDIVLKGPLATNPKNKVAPKFQWKPNLVERYRMLGFEPKVIKAKYTNSARDLSHLVIVNVEECHGR